MAQNQGTMLLLGANSDIGGEIAVRMCQGRVVVLAGRDRARAVGVEKRLLDAGAREVRFREFEATDLDSHRPLIEAMRRCHHRDRRLRHSR